MIYFNRMMCFKNQLLTVRTVLLLLMALNVPTFAANSIIEIETTKESQYITKSQTYRSKNTDLKQTQGISLEPYEHLSKIQTEQVLPDAQDDLAQNPETGPLLRCYFETAKDVIATTLDQSRLGGRWADQIYFRRIDALGGPPVVFFRVMEGCEEEFRKRVRQASQMSHDDVIRVVRPFFLLFIRAMTARHYTICLENDGPDWAEILKMCRESGMRDVNLIPSLFEQQDRKP